MSNLANLFAYSYQVMPELTVPAKFCVHVGAMKCLQYSYFSRVEILPCCVELLRNRLGIP